MKLFVLAMSTSDVIGVIILVIIIIIISLAMNSNATTKKGALMDGVGDLAKITSKGIQGVSEVLKVNVVESEFKKIQLGNEFFTNYQMEYSSIYLHPHFKDKEGLSEAEKRDLGSSIDKKFREAVEKNKELFYLCKKLKIKTLFIESSNQNIIMPGGRTMSKVDSKFTVGETGLSKVDFRQSSLEEKLLSIAKNNIFELMENYKYPSREGEFECLIFSASYVFNKVSISQYIKESFSKNKYVELISQQAKKYNINIETRELIELIHKRFELYLIYDMNSCVHIIESAYYYFYIEPLSNRKMPADIDLSDVPSFYGSFYIMQNKLSEEVKRDF